MYKLATRTITYHLRAHKLYRSGARGHPALKLINWQCGWFLLQEASPPSPARPQRRNQWHCASYAKHCTLISRSFLIYFFPPNSGVLKAHTGRSQNCVGECLFSKLGCIHIKLTTSDDSGVSQLLVLQKKPTKKPTKTKKMRWIIYLPKEKKKTKQLLWGNSWLRYRVSDSSRRSAHQ